MIDLDYADPAAPAIAPDHILTVGRRVRRRRRAAGGGSMALMVAVLAWTATVMLPQSGSVPAAFDPAPGKHRPSDPVVIVGTPIAGWRAFVFRSTDDGLCMGSAAYSGPDQGYTSYVCTDAGNTSVVLPGVWIQKPTFESAPLDGKHVLAIGLVRGPATTVTLDFFGRQAIATVVPVQKDGWEGLGAYCLWLSTNGEQTFGTANVTDVEAWDSDGRLVTSLP